MELCKSPHFTLEKLNEALNKVRTWSPRLEVR